MVFDGDLMVIYIYYIIYRYIYDIYIWDLMEFNLHTYGFIWDL